MGRTCLAAPLERAQFSMELPLCQPVFTGSTSTGLPYGERTSKTPTSPIRTLPEPIWVRPI